MKDPVARDQAAYAIAEVAAEAELRRSAIDELRGLVRKADVIPAPNPTFGVTNQWTASLTSGTTHETIAEGVHKAILDADSTHNAVRTAVLTIVLCYENLRDALQFDTWGGLQDAKTLDERAAVLRGWLGTATDEEMEAATACYDELAGT